MIKYRVIFFQLPVEARIEVTKKAIKAVKHLSEKSRKKPSENDVEDAENPSVAYEETLNHLQQSLAHLETLTHSFITSLKNSEQVMITDQMLLLSIAMTSSDGHQSSVRFYSCFVPLFLLIWFLKIHFHQSFLFCSVC